MRYQSLETHLHHIDSLAELVFQVGAGDDCPQRLTGALCTAGNGLAA